MHFWLFVSAFLFWLFSDVLLVFQDFFREYNVTLLAVKVIVGLTFFAMPEA
jgi:hypothetical protein